MIINENDDQKSLPINVIGSGVARSKRWLVAIVRICHEKKTSERLTKMGIENFLPIQQEVHQWSDRRKIVDRVLIPMMIFVHVDSHEQKEVLTLSSISRYMVLRGESTPAVIPDQQMLRFKFMLDYSDEAISMNTSPLAPGEKIRVIKGPLTKWLWHACHVPQKQCPGTVNIPLMPVPRRKERHWLSPGSVWMISCP